MIYIRVELWPKGDRKRSRLLGEGVIENVGGDDKVGDYRMSIAKPAGFQDPTQPRARECWKQDELSGFARQSKLGAWDLLLLMLAKLLWDRMPRMRAQ